jgi:hypothetical protein
MEEAYSGELGSALKIRNSTGQATSLNTVITKAAGDLITAFPDVP